MLSYVIAGSGYRSQYYARVARTYPELFRAVYLCRSPEKVRLMHLQTGLEAFLHADDLPFRPDFAVIAVDRASIAQVTEEWLDRGIPVVAEPPVGNTQEELIRLWNRHLRGDRIVCCEQYHRQPLLAAGLDVIRSGQIGDPTSMYISLLHDYHAMSLIRRALLGGRMEPYVLHGTSHTSEYVETDSRNSAFWDGRTASALRSTVHITFQSGKEAIYDFCPVQYRSYIRSRHLTVRDTRGEWNDTRILYLDAQNEPRRLSLTPAVPERYRCLDTQALRDRRRTFTAELAPDTVQDEFAIASILFDMADYLAGGPIPYPLEEALEDAYFTLLSQQTQNSPWAAVPSEQMPWQS
ncbi:MAG: hypothetical protein IJ088_04695 [Clostridia bacterium]|nr:hypothetical protein [Clostridia bacterium]